MHHPACDFARHVMQVALAGTGVRLSDGATNVMPSDRTAPRRRPLIAPSAAENLARPPRLAAPLRRRAPFARQRLLPGLGPAPGPAADALRRRLRVLPRGLDAASERLRNFVEKAAQATLVGDVFDDAATGQGLLNYFLRGDELRRDHASEEAVRNSGLTLEELRGAIVREDSRKPSRLIVASIRPYGWSVATKISLGLSRPKGSRFTSRWWRFGMVRVTAVTSAQAAAPHWPSRRACAAPSGSHGGRTSTRAWRIRCRAPKSFMPRRYVHDAVTDVARTRSCVSGSVVNPSRGNPENSRSVVFRSTRFSSPDVSVMSASRSIPRDNSRPPLASRLNERVRMRMSVNRTRSQWMLGRLKCATVTRELVAKNVRRGATRRPRRGRWDRVSRRHRRCSSSYRSR